MPVVPKNAWLFWWYLSNKTNFQEKFQEKMLIKIQHTTLIQIFCEFMINSRVIPKSISDPDYFLSRWSPGMKGLKRTSSVGDSKQGTLHGTTSHLMNKVTLIFIVITSWWKSTPLYNCLTLADSQGVSINCLLGGGWGKKIASRRTR